jgi:hypothetical protein
MPTYIAILTLLEYFTNNFGAKSYKRDRRAKTPPAHHGDHLFETCSSFFFFETKTFSSCARANAHQLSA